MIEVKVTHINLDKKLSKLSNRYQHPRKLMLAVSGDMMDAVEENFEREGRPKWPQLTESTLRQRRRTGKNGPILQPGNAGGLAASINSRATNTEAIAGTNKHYGKYLQKGTKNMKKRPFLKLTDGDVSHIKTRVGNYFSGD